MSYCNGLCKHLNEKKHKCELTGEKLTYVKGWWGITHEHVGFLDCDKDESEILKSAANATDGKNGG